MKTHMLVLRSGDDALKAIAGFAAQQSIEGATFSALGAFETSTIAYWNRETKEYEPIEVPEQVEVLTMTGNVAMAGTDRRLHAHVILGRRDGSTMGGHLMKAVVHPTLEVFIVDLGMRLARTRDETTGLWLLT